MANANGKLHSQRLQQHLQNKIVNICNAKIKIKIPISALVPFCTSVIIFPVEGLTVGNVSPDFDLCQSLLMKIYNIFNYNVKHNKNIQTVINKIKRII